MKLRRLYYLLFLGIAFALSAPLSMAQSQQHGALLGGGGTNYSNRKPDHNGLLTGTNSAIHHLIGFYVEGAYSQMLHTRKDLMAMPQGYAFGGGLLYEYQHFYLKCQTGIGIRIQNIDTRVNDLTITDNQVKDAMGYPYTLTYHFKDRVDKGQYMHLQVPLLAGTAYKHFYLLAGLKLNFSLLANNQVSAICSTSATYNNFIGDFTEMDNHGMRKDVPVASEGELFPMKFDVLASCELGAEFAPSRFGDTDYRMYMGYARNAYRFRVAAFCDFGLVSMIPNTTHQIVDIPQNYKWDFSTFRLNHVISSDLLKGVPLHNFYAGIKISLFLDCYRDGECKIFGDYQTEADMANFY